MLHVWNILHFLIIFCHYWRKCRDSYSVHGASGIWSCEFRVNYSPQTGRAFVCRYTWTMATMATMATAEHVHIDGFRLVVDLTNGKLHLHGIHLAHGAGPSFSWWPRSDDYALVVLHSYWKWQFTVGFPIKHSDCPVRYFDITRGLCDALQQTEASWGFVKRVAGFGPKGSKRSPCHSPIPCSQRFAALIIQPSLATGLNKFLCMRMGSYGM